MARVINDGIPDGTYVRYGQPDPVSAPSNNPVTYGGRQSLQREISAPGGQLATTDAIVCYVGPGPGTLVLPLLATMMPGQQILVIPSLQTPFAVLEVDVPAPDAGSLAGVFDGLLLSTYPGDAVTFTACAGEWAVDRSIVPAGGVLAAISHEIYQSDAEHRPAGTPLAIPLAGTFYPWVSANSAPIILATPWITRTGPGQYTINDVGGGAYDIEACVSLMTTLGSIVEIAVRIDGAPLASGLRQTYIDPLGTILGNVSIVGRRFLPGSTTIDLACTSNVPADTITIYDVTLSIHRP